jgi:hypothetical protein
MGLFRRRRGREQPDRWTVHIQPRSHDSSDPLRAVRPWGRENLRGLGPDHIDVWAMRDAGYVDPETCRAKRQEGELRCDALL